MDFVRRVAVVAPVLCLSACEPSDWRIASEVQPPFQMWSLDHIRTLQDRERDGEEVDPIPHRSASSYDFCDGRMGASRWEDRPILHFKRWNRRDFFEMRGGRFIGSIGEHEDCDDVRLTWLDDANPNWVGESTGVTDMTHDDFSEWVAVQPEVMDGERRSGGSQRGFFNWMKKMFGPDETYRALIQSGHCYLIDHSHKIGNTVVHHDAVSIFRVRRHKEDEMLIIDQVRSLVSSRR